MIEQACQSTRLYCTLGLPSFCLRCLSVLFLRYQKLWKSYVKLRHLLANSPKVKQTDKQKLAQREVGIRAAASAIDGAELRVHFEIVVTPHFYNKKEEYFEKPHSSPLLTLVCRLTFFHVLVFKGPFPPQIDHFFKKQKQG